MKVKSLLKIFLSIVMLGLVLTAVDFQELKKILLNFPIYILILIFIVYLAGQVLSAVKWWLIARYGGINAPFPAALKSYFIGQFVNCFGLGVVGGDVTRGLLLSHGKPQKTPAIASVVADRLHGLAILSLICLVSFLAVGGEHLSRSLEYLLFSISVGIVIGWYLGPYLLLKIVPPRSKYRRKTEQLCHVFPTSPRLLFVISALSFIFHLSQIWLHWLMGVAFGLDIGWGILLTAIPVVNILATLPISWNGLGVREKSYTYFLTPAVLSAEQAVAFGAIWLLAVTFSSALGGIVSMITKDFEVISEIEKTEDYAALEKENA